MLEQIEDQEMMNIIHQNNYRIKNSRVIKNRKNYLKLKTTNENNLLPEVIALTSFYIIFTLTFLYLFIGSVS